MRSEVVKNSISVLPVRIYLHPLDVSSKYGTTKVYDTYIHLSWFWKEQKWYFKIRSSTFITSGKNSRTNKSNAMNENDENRNSILFIIRVGTGISIEKCPFQLPMNSSRFRIRFSHNTRSPICLYWLFFRRKQIKEWEKTAYEAHNGDIVGL